MYPKVKGVSDYVDKLRPHFIEKIIMAYASLGILSAIKNVIPGTVTR
jgi:hypothetical protein